MAGIKGKIVKEVEKIPIDWEMSDLIERHFTYCKIIMKKEEMLYAG